MQKIDRIKKVAIIDFKLGNLFSVVQACKINGLNVVITDDRKEIFAADGLIMPGVGAFGDAMINLMKLDLVSPIKDFIGDGRPFLGICLGFQLLFSTSEEFGDFKGLDIIKGSVRRFENKNNMKIKVPQIGWNTIYANKDWSLTPLFSIPQNEYMYFVHSYYVDPENKNQILTHTNYEGIEYCSSIIHKNIFATQFHPEKSGEKGIEIYKNWSKLL